MSAPAYVKKPHPWFEGAPFRTASSFSSPHFISKFIDGKGGKWLDYEKRFIDRLQLQTESPIRARRVPCEARDWAGDHPFFSTRASHDAWDYGALRRGERPGANKNLPALTVRMQKYLLIQIGLAREFNMKLELVVDWTLKHSGTGRDAVGWAVIGHCIRQTAAFLRLVHIGKWDTGVDGNAIGHPMNQKASDRIRAMFDEVKGPIDHLVAFELHNEFDAHSRHSWLKDDMNPAQALAEVNRQLERTKRLKNGEPEQWPEGATWVSHGGRDDIAYDPAHADAVAIHPSRPGMNVGDRFRGLRKHGKQIYANEIHHYVPPAYWYLIDNGTFRPRSSTKDTAARKKFVEDMLADGMVVCEHSLTNMANGRWKDADNDFSEMELDPYEKAWGAKIGDVNPPPPDPDPDPTPDPDPDPGPGDPPPPPGNLPPLWQLDIDNARQTKIQRLPEIRYGIMKLDKVLDETVSIDPKERRLLGAWVFMGVDPDDKLEYAVSVYGNGLPVLLTSPHKETVTIYDGWRWFRNEVELDPLKRLEIAVSANVTGTNGMTPRAEGQDTARPHFGVWFVWNRGQSQPPGRPAPVVPPAPVQPPEDEPSTQPAPQPSEFMPRWDQMRDKGFGRAPHRTATWRKALMSIDQQLIWDGIRHPTSVLSWSDFEWPYRGAGQPVDEARARDILGRSTTLLARLRHFVEFDPRDGRAIAIGGTWREGRVRRENFEEWYEEFVGLWPWLESINGITARP